MVVHTLVPLGVLASMKVPPKRKGNKTHSSPWQSRRHRLNESPSEKEGKFACKVTVDEFWKIASMKVPPKRKGNTIGDGIHSRTGCLNESPSEKEGKSLLEHAAVPFDT